MQELPGEWFPSPSSHGASHKRPGRWVRFLLAPPQTTRSLRTLSPSARLASALFVFTLVIRAGFQLFLAIFGLKEKGLHPTVS